CYYCVAAWLAAVFSIFTDFEKVYAPLGFLIPVLGAKIDFTWARPTSPLGLLLSIVIVTFLYGATGWLSGLVCAVSYNLFSKRLGIQVLGLVDPQRPTGPVAGGHFLDLEKD